MSSTDPAAQQPQPHDFQQPETFGVGDRKAESWRRLLGPILIMPIILFLLMWFMAAAAFNAFNVPGGSWSALLVALVLTAILIFAWLKKTEAAVGHSSVTVDAQGISLTDGHITRSLAWQDITAVGRVAPIRGVELRKQHVAAAVNRTVQAMSGSIGLLGRGTLAAEDGRPLAGTIAQQNEGIWGHADTGEPLVGIAPAEIDANWYQGRIGDWLRHQRPDLAAEYERQVGGSAEG
ncbi:hypothetical protein [Parenemella sanctibonifatiensis]|uniref:Uncharacterized protein n=1 Tax=Parenemella sanctibonifatiensis TaxID=2016505 RepID=A0A255EG53_9ACTN|nr:hypothetical protein [Parenemella sanctibonifatiensis]OYN90514.1 hypothetical protein CGZ92_01400 [Parenemella sanctibonifatiensis]